MLKYTCPQANTMMHSRGRDVRKSCRKPCQGKVSSVGLSSILALILTPGPCARAALQLYPHLSKSFANPWHPAHAQICFNTTAQPGTHRAGSDPVQLLHELWDVAHRVQFIPWPIPLPLLAAQLFQSSLLLLPHCIFSHYFMQSSQETKKISHPYLHIPGYSLHYCKT